MNCPLGDNRHNKHAAHAKLLLIAMTRLTRNTEHGVYSLGGALYECSRYVRSDLGVFFGGVAYLESESYLTRNTVRRYLDAFVRCGVLYGGNRKIVTQWRKINPTPGSPPQVYELNDGIGPADRWLPAAFHEAYLWASGKGEISSTFASWEAAREQLIPEYVRRQLDVLHNPLVEYDKGSADEAESSEKKTKSIAREAKSNEADAPTQESLLDAAHAVAEVEQAPAIDASTLAPSPPVNDTDAALATGDSAGIESEDAADPGPAQVEQDSEDHPGAIDGSRDPANGIPPDRSGATERSGVRAGTAEAMEHLLSLPRDLRTRPSGSTEKHSLAAKRLQELYWSTLAHTPTAESKKMALRQNLQDHLDSGRPIEGESGLWEALVRSKSAVPHYNTLERLLDGAGDRNGFRSISNSRSWQPRPVPAALLANAGAAGHGDASPDDGFPWAPQAVAT